MKGNKPTTDEDADDFYQAIDLGDKPGVIRTVTREDLEKHRITSSNNVSSRTPTTKDALKEAIKQMEDAKLYQYAHKTYPIDPRHFEIGIDLGVSVEPDLTDEQQKTIDSLPHMALYLLKDVIKHSVGAPKELLDALDAEVQTRKNAGVWI